MTLVRSPVSIRQSRTMLWFCVIGFAVVTAGIGCSKDPKPKAVEDKAPGQVSANKAPGKVSADKAPGKVSADNASDKALDKPMATKRGAKLSPGEIGKALGAGNIERGLRRRAIGQAFGKPEATLYDADVRAALAISADSAPSEVSKAALAKLEQRFKAAGCDLASFANVRPDKRGRAFVENCKPGGVALIEPRRVAGVPPEFVVIAASMVHNARAHGFENSPDHKAAVAEMLATADIVFDGANTTLQGKGAQDDALADNAVLGDNPIWLFLDTSTYAKPVQTGHVLDSLAKIAFGRPLVFRGGGRKGEDVTVTWGQPSPLPNGRVEVRIGPKKAEIVATNDARDEIVSGSVTEVGKAFAPAMYNKLVNLLDVNLPKVTHIVIVPERSTAAGRVVAALSLARWRLGKDEFGDDSAWMDAKVKETTDASGVTAKQPLFPQIYLAPARSKLSAKMATRDPDMADSLVDPRAGGFLALRGQPPGVGPFAGGSDLGDALKTGSGPFVGGGGVAKRPVATLGRVTVDGALPRATVQRIVRRSLSGIRWCYQDALQRDLTLKGKVSVTFGIAPSGKTVDPTATSASKSLGDKGLVACVLNKMGRWRFPSPTDGKAAKVKFSLTLKTL